MKKFLILLAAICLSITVVGCGNESGQNSSNINSSSSSSNSEQNQDSSNEYKVGDLINFEGEEITVTKVERKYDTGNQYIKPKAENEFVKVSINIKNISNKDISVNAYEFKLQNSNGSVEDISATTYNLEDTFDSAELIPGGTKHGSIVFEAPKGDADLKLVYEPSFLSSKQLKIKL